MTTLVARVCHHTHRKSKSDIIFAYFSPCSGSNSARRLKQAKRRRLSATANNPGILLFACKRDNSPENPPKPGHKQRSSRQSARNPLGPSHLELGDHRAGLIWSHPTKDGGFDQLKSNHRGKHSSYLAITLPVLLRHSDNILLYLKTYQKINSSSTFLAPRSTRHISGPASSDAFAGPR